MSERIVVKQNDSTLLQTTRTIVVAVKEGPRGYGVPPGGSIGKVLAKKTSANYDTEWVDQGGSSGSNYSVGIVDPESPVMTDLGNGSATFASCRVALRDNSNSEGSTSVYEVSQATLSFTDGSQEYVAIKYNAGSPVYYVESNINNLNGSDVAMIAVVWRQGTKLHSSDQDSIGLGLPNKTNRRMLMVQPYAIASTGGLVPSEVTTPNPRTIVVSSAVVFRGVIGDNVSSFNSSVDKMTKVIKTVSGWSYTDVLVYDNTGYNPTTGGESTLGVSKWGYRLIYRSIGDENQVFYVQSPDQYNSESSARTASDIGRSDLPVLITGHCLLVGRSLIQYNATSGITERFIRSGGYYTSETPNHNDLPGIQGGQSGEYYHLKQDQVSKLDSSRVILAGTGSPPDTTGLTEGTIYLQYS